MGATVGDKFIALRPEQTRCPGKVRALAPSARRIYVLRERFDCRYWAHVGDCFLQVKGTWIVTEPAAGRRHFTTKPGTVLTRLRKLGVW